MQIKKSINEGLSFGVTSGVITTLGLMVGLSTSTHSKLAVIGGILSIALADSLSDSLGMHIAKETEKVNNRKEIWEITFFTFLTKLITASTFAIPVIFLKLTTATIISVLWGMVLLCVQSYFIAKDNDEKYINVILEHTVLGSIIVAASAIFGNIISMYFG